MASLLLAELAERPQRAGCYARLLRKDLAAISTAGAGLQLDSINQSEMSAWFVVVTRDEDREADVVEPEGCLDYLGEYKDNPIVLWDHNHDESLPPVGRCEGPDGKFTLIVKPDRILAKCFFHDLTWKGNKIGEETFHLVVNKFLRGASPGFLPIEANARGYGKDAGKHYFRWRLTEWSITPMPSQQNALAVDQVDFLRRSLSRGEIKTKSLADSLSRYLPPEPVWANGADLPGAESMKPKTAAIRIAKSILPVRSAAAAWCKSHGRDGSSCVEEPDAWVFRQSLDEVDPNGKQQLAKGIYALHAKALKCETKDGEEEEEKKPDETAADSTAEVTKAEGDKPEDKPADATEEPVEPETPAEETATEEEADKENPVEAEDHSQKPGAKDLAALSEHFDMLMAGLTDMLGRNENSDVAALLGQLQADAAKVHADITACAAKAYNGLDLDSLKSTAIAPEETATEPETTAEEPAPEVTPEPEPDEKDDDTVFKGLDPALLAKVNEKTGVTAKRLSKLAA